MAVTPGLKAAAGIKKGDSMTVQRKLWADWKGLDEEEKAKKTTEAKKNVMRSKGGGESEQRDISEYEKKTEKLKKQKAKLESQIAAGGKDISGSFKRRGQAVRTAQEARGKLKSIELQISNREINAQNFKKGTHHLDGRRKSQAKTKTQKQPSNVNARAINQQLTLSGSAKLPNGAKLEVDTDFSRKDGNTRFKITKASGEVSFTQWRSSFADAQKSKDWNKFV